MSSRKSVHEATAEYRDAQDVVGQFIADCCAVITGAEVKASTLYAAYKKWAEENGERQMTNRRFGAAIEEREFMRKRNNGSWYVGLDVNPLPD